MKSKFEAISTVLAFLLLIAVFSWQREKYTEISKEISEGISEKISAQNEEEAADIIDSEESRQKQTADAMQKSCAFLQIYHSDEAAVNLCASTISVEEITPELILKNLVDYHVVSTDVTINQLETIQENGKVLLMLDFSKEFQDDIMAMGDGGEYMTLGGICNTFLDAYDADKILITVEGMALETDHAVYAESISMFGYREASYSVISCNIYRDHLNVSYPQLEGLADTEIQDKLNHFFQTRTEESIGDLEINTGRYNMGYTVKTMSDEILSILVDGTYFPDDTQNQYSFKFTYNFDMQTGACIRLAEYEDVEVLSNQLMEGKGCQVEDNLIDNFQERLFIMYGDAGQLANSLKEYDFKYDGSAGYGYSYIEDGKTHLCMEVPHALGDFVEIEFRKALQNSQNILVTTNN